MKVRRRPFPLMPDQRAAKLVGERDPRKGKKENPGNHQAKMRTTRKDGRVAPEVYTRSVCGY